MNTRKLASLLTVAGGLAVAMGVPTATAYAQCAGRSAARCNAKGCAGKPCAGKSCAAKPCAAKPHHKHRRTRHHHS